MTKNLHTTNYINTFIAVAEDCPATSGELPPERAGQPTVAGLQYAMIINTPYAYTSDDVVFATSAAGRNVDSGATATERQTARDAFFSKAQPCLRASALGKKFGWGIHSDQNGRIAIVSVGSNQYNQLATDSRINQVKAMRSKKA